MRRIVQHGDDVLAERARRHRCGEHTLSFLNDAIGEWAEQSHWPVGTPVTVQWTINVNGDGFETTHVSSTAWQGLDQDNVLAILFQ